MYFQSYFVTKFNKSKILKVSEIKRVNDSKDTVSGNKKLGKISSL